MEDFQVDLEGIVYGQASRLSRQCLDRVRVTQRFQSIFQKTAHDAAITTFFVTENQPSRQSACRAKVTFIIER